MRNLIRCLLFFGLFLTVSNCGAMDVRNGQQAPQATAVTRASSYPKIVLYSLSWCPHCKQAKEYFAAKNIPFENRDVEQDEEARDTLLNKYQSNTVPLIVIGNDEAVLREFSPEIFEQALDKLKKP